MALDYGFDAAGGFYVLDHERRVADYAYPTSAWAARAKKNPAKTAAEMNAGDGWRGMREIVEHHYLRVCEAAGFARYGTMAHGKKMAEVAMGGGK